MTKTDFPHGDIKFYYHIHANRQKAMWLEPVCYENFYRRLRKGMNLHDAIYSPRVEYQVREYPRQPIQDNIRRVKKLNEENIPIIECPNWDKGLRSKFISLFT